MNRFVIVDGLPYLLAHGKTYSVRWDEKGFTVGAEVELASVPARTFSELSVRAKCAGHLDSIHAPEGKQEQADQGNQQESTNEPEEPTVYDRMTVKELKVYAETFGVDIDGLTRKTDIINAIKAVQNE